MVRVTEKRHCLLLVPTLIIIIITIIIIRSAKDGGLFEENEEGKADVVFAGSTHAERHSRPVPVCFYSGNDPGLPHLKRERRRGREYIYIICLCVCV